MGKIPHTLMLRSLYGGVFLILIVFVALLVNVLMSHKASAGGAIMIGSSVIINGQDRVTGEKFPSLPLVGEVPTGVFVSVARLAPIPRVIRVYQGDTVRFMGVALNVDPFPIPGVFAMTQHSKGFNETTNPLNIFEYYNRNVVANRDWIPTVGTGVAVVPEVSNFIMITDPVQMVGPGSDKPGKRYCQFISTNPTFYLGFIPVIPYVDWKLDDIVDLSQFANTDALNDSSVTGVPFRAEVAAGMRAFLSNFRFGRTMSCAEIAYNYNLTPSIGLSGTNGVSLSVQNDTEMPGKTQTYTKESEWRITQFTAQDTADSDIQDLMNRTTESTRFPCQVLAQEITIAANRADCITLTESAGRNTIFNKNGEIDSTIDSNNRGTPFPTSLPDPPAATHVCYMLSVNLYKPYGSNPNWRNSKIVCKAGGPKKPKVQVYGDDIRVGGGIFTSQSPVSSLAKTFGSWGQYASYSVKNVDGYATASGLKDGIANATDVSAYSKLTFANTISPLGRFDSSVNSKGATDVKKLFDSLTSTPIGISPRVITSLTPGPTPYVFTSPTATLELQGDTIAKGRTHIIVASGNVRITSDIKYTTDRLASLAELPQVVIVAKNITIDKDVEQVDAWLIADSQTGVINTCGNEPGLPTGLTTGVCTKQLRVNGPVVANKLLLYRTHGSSGSTVETLGTPAEMFSNNGDAYLWAYNYAKNNRSLVTTRQIELPPRY